MAKDRSGLASFAMASLVFGIVIIFVTIGAMAAMIWWKHYGKEFVWNENAAFEQGRREGCDSGETDCLKTVTDLIWHGDSLENMKLNTIEIRACLSAAHPSETFCEAVPT